MKGSLSNSIFLVLFSIFLICQTNSVAFADTVVSKSTEVEAKERLLKLPVIQELAAQMAGLDEAFETSQIAESAKIAQAVSFNPKDEVPVLEEGISVNDKEIENKIDTLTRDILLKQIELERFVINYNINSAKQGRFKGWRYGFFGEANLADGLAGGIISVINRGGHLHDPKHVNVRVQEQANYIPMIGNIIGAGAAGLEFSINQWHEIEAAKKGYSQKKAYARVKQLKEEIDGLLKERAKIVQSAFSIPTLRERAELDKAEQTVLRNMLSLSLQQYERFSIGKRQLLAFQQMQYLFDISKNVTSAVGYRFAYNSLARRHRIYNGVGGIFFVISGGLYMTGPVLSRVYARYIANKHRRLLRPTTQVSETETIEELKKNHAMLDKCCKESSCDKADMVVDRSSSIYASGEKVFEDEIERSQKVRDKAKLIATQNIAAGAFVGGTKVASGVLFLIPGYNSRYNVSGTAKADRGTNDFLFASSLISLPATSFAILDTLRINIQGERNRQKLKKQGELPDQLAKVRLEELDRIEKKVRAIAIN